MTRKIGMLMLLPLTATLLTACGQPNQNKSQATQDGTNQTANPSSQNQTKYPTTWHQNTSNKGTWYHNNAKFIAQNIANSSNTLTALRYRQGFGDGNDNGDYQWNPKIHRQANNASNAFASAGMTNGVINVKLMNDVNYQYGWILSFAQGSSDATQVGFRGVQSVAKYQNAYHVFQQGMQYAKHYHETKYVVYDDGDKQWFTHNAAALNRPSF